MKHLKNIEKPKENYKLHILSTIKETNTNILSYFLQIAKINI